MGYTLKPINKECESIDFGAFSWPIMLQDTGMGYILGYGQAKNPAQYVYQNGNMGSPVSNDGYKVTATEAKMMARIARGYISVKEFINKEWAELSEEDREREKNFKYEGKLLYMPETGEKFLEQLRKFADFAEKSKGFRIR